MTSKLYETVCAWIDSNLYSYSYSQPITNNELYELRYEMDKCIEEEKIYNPFNQQRQTIQEVELVLYKKAMKTILEASEFHSQTGVSAECARYAHRSTANLINNLQEHIEKEKQQILERTQHEKLDT